MCAVPSAACSEPGFCVPGQGDLADDQGIELEVQLVGQRPRDRDSTRRNRQHQFVAVDGRPQELRERLTGLASIFEHGLTLSERRIFERIFRQLFHEKTSYFSQTTDVEGDCAHLDRRTTTTCFFDEVEKVLVESLVVFLNLGELVLVPRRYPADREQVGLAVADRIEETHGVVDLDMDPLLVALVRRVVKDAFFSHGSKGRTREASRMVRRPFESAYVSGERW